MTDDDLTDQECVETFAKTKTALLDVEERLGRTLGLPGSPSEVHCHLLKLDRQGKLVESNLVADWHDLYASYLDWLAQEVPPQVPAEDRGGGSMVR